MSRRWAFDGELSQRPCTFCSQHNTLISAGRSKLPIDACIGGMMLSHMEVSAEPFLSIPTTRYNIQ